MLKRVAIVAALEREVKPSIKRWRVSEREYAGRSFRFFEKESCVLVCGGIGAQAARRASEAVVALYSPEVIISIGFAGALDESLAVGDVFVPRKITDAGDSSTSDAGAGQGTLLSLGSVASAEQKARLARAYGAQAVDMEAASVSRAATVHGIRFMAVKAISDDRDFDMPDLDRFVKDGQFRTAAFFAHTVLQPRLWPRLVCLARNSAKARKTLCDWLDKYNWDPEFLEKVPSGLHLISKRKN